MVVDVLEELDSEMGDKVKIVKLDVDDNQETAAKFGVMSIPTLIVFKTRSRLLFTVPRNHLSFLLSVTKSFP
jgi:thioredoxin-related protein